MDNRDDWKKYAPIAGGVILGVGLLALMYKLFGGKKKCTTGQTYVCTRRTVEAVRCYPLRVPLEQDDDCYMSGKPGGPPQRPPRPTKFQRFYKRAVTNGKKFLRYSAQAAMYYAFYSACMLFYEHIYKCKMSPLTHYVCTLYDQKNSIYRCYQVSKEDMKEITCEDNKDRMKHYPFRYV